MAFDQSTRNRLARFVSEARNLLTEEFTRQLQHEYGLDPASGEVTAIEKLTALDDARRETARILRETLEYYQAALTPAALTPGPSSRGRGRREGKSKEALERILREQAFTVLNRLCALRMAEARGLILEAVARGYQSRGFQLYARLAGSALGETGEAYRAYLFSVFDELAVELPPLFDRYSPQGRLFPSQAALLRLLELLNAPELEGLWAEDETIGWIYQYFNSKEERKAMRDASPAPRNSRELAVRNQFFTPRYVVEFLTDNTLGRTWYEMTQGETGLVDACRYLVRRPTEIFLAQGEAAPPQLEAEADLSQEELLRQPAHIPHRPLKDPREIKLLDPACGSMHFGLYAFDLFELIYAEAWDIEEAQGSEALGRPADLEPLHQAYPDKESCLRDAPRLIIERNIHGIDIDPRAVQIAGLSLWLRAQKSWQAQGLAPAARPLIRRANIVCAEALPGDGALLDEFAAGLAPKALGPLVKTIFEKMKLAGEAGSLLKIEHEIQTAVEDARRDYHAWLLVQKKQAGYLPGLAPERPTSLFEWADLPDAEHFWPQAEGRLLEALRDYAERAQNDSGFQRRMFAADTARGFAFIDLCRKRYDVVVMNPPFGDSSDSSIEFVSSNYDSWNLNILCAFIIRGKNLLSHRGKFGAIFDRTAAVKSSYEEFRRKHLVPYILTLADTGWNVLDANVETTIYVLSSERQKQLSLFFDVLDMLPVDKSNCLLEQINQLHAMCINKATYLRKPTNFLSLPNAVVGYSFNDLLIRLFKEWRSIAFYGLQARKGHDFISDQHFRLFWEVNVSSNSETGLVYTTLYNGSGFTMFSVPLRDVVLIKSDILRYQGIKSIYLRNHSYHLHSGIGYGKRGDVLDAHLLCEGAYFTSEGLGITCISHQDAYIGLAYLNSSLAQYIINQYCGQHKQVGYVNLLPFPTL